MICEMISIHSIIGYHGTKLLWDITEFTSIAADIAGVEYEL